MLQCCPGYPVTRSRALARRVPVVCTAAPTAQARRERAPQLVITEIRGRERTTYTTNDSRSSNSSSSSSSSGSSSTHSDLREHGGQSTSSSSGIVRAGDALRALFLPEGYPSSVTPDYLPYQLWSVPCHISGWLSHSLATSSLLKAVGVSAGVAGTVAAAAAIKWIAKDGIGAAGRALVGGRLGAEFDGDPARWRMIAEAMTTAGLALEIATSIYPDSFLLLASTGNFAKAVGKGVGKPVFRVVQTHFAAAGNVGAVAAKEEVWEVAGQLAGYAASVLLLQALEGAGSWHTLVGVWALVQAAHVGLRFVALSQLQFDSLSQKRAAMLVAAHAAGRALPRVAECNREEPMLVAATALRPRVQFGESLEGAWGGRDRVPSGQLLGRWLRLYRGEDYLLVWRDGVAYVLVQEGYAAEALLRAMLQAGWLDAHGNTADGTDCASTASSSSCYEQQLELLERSVVWLRQEYGGFLAAAADLGWDTSSLVARVRPCRVSIAEAVVPP